MATSKQSAGPGGASSRVQPEASNGTGVLLRRTAMSQPRSDTIGRSVGRSIGTLPWPVFCVFFRAMFVLSRCLRLSACPTLVLYGGER